MTKLQKQISSQVSEHRILAKKMFRNSLTLLIVGILLVFVWMGVVLSLSLSKKFTLEIIWIAVPFSLLVGLLVFIFNKIWKKGVYHTLQYEYYVHEELSLASKQKQSVKSWEIADDHPARIYFVHEFQSDSKFKVLSYLKACFKYNSFVWK